MDKKIVVCYQLALSQKNFEKVLSHAQELGHGFDDAGPAETIRRFLMDAGIGEVDELLEDPQAMSGSIQRDFGYIKLHQK